jgi:hypothetical protein
LTKLPLAGLMHPLLKNDASGPEKGAGTLFTSAFLFGAPASGWRVPCLGLPSRHGWKPGLRNPVCILDEQADKFISFSCATSRLNQRRSPASHIHGQTAASGAIRSETSRPAALVSIRGGRLLVDRPLLPVLPDGTTHAC